MTKHVLLSLCLAFSLFLTGCKESNKEVQTPEKPSLYERIGKQPAVDAAVDLFYTKVLADDRVNHFFEDVNMNKQHNKQKQFIAAVLGGPVPYTGKNMRDAHKNLDLKESDFGIIAGHLQATLKELKVDDQLIAEVIALVATTKDDVLNR